MDLSSLYSGCETAFMTAAAVAAVICFVRFGTKWVKKALEIPDDEPLNSGKDWEGGVDDYFDDGHIRVSGEGFEEPTEFASKSEFETWLKEHGYR